MDIVDFRWNTSGQPRAGAAARLAAYFLAALCVVAALCLIVASPAQAKDWRIDSLDVTLDVQPDSRVLVTEKITFTFEGSYSFVGRLIPTGKVDSIGAVEVFRDGTALPVGDGPDSYSTFMEGEYLVVQLNFALADTTATWEIRYVAEGALSYFDDVDELVWRVFDADTPVPIGSVRVTMNLPGSTPSDLLVAAVDTGPDVYNTTSSPGPSMIVFEADDVAPYTHFWIAGGFPKGVVGHPWTYRRVMSFITPRVGFALPIFTLLMMLLVWVRRGRDEPSVVHASFIAEPPSGLSPAMAGALLDEKVEHREVLATLAELARRGYVKLPDATGSKQASAQRLQLLKPAAELRGLEALVVSTIFPGGAVNVTGATIGERLRGLTVPFEEAVFAEIVKAGYFAESPKAARSAWRKRTWWFGLLLAVVTIFLMLEDIGGWGYFFVGAVASVLAMRMFVRRMPQRTAAGAQEQRKWEAFRNYLRDLQRFQDLETARDSFERFLPYAVAFGVERNWARRFEGLSLPAPGWMVPVPVPTSLPSGDVPSPGSVGGPVGAGPVWAPAADTAPAGPSGGGSAPLTLDTLSDRIFGGLDGVTRTLLSAPSSTGSGRGASGGHRSTSSRSSSGSSFGSRSSSRSGGWTSSSRGSSGGSSRGFSGGGGGGGFRAG
ncbi:MAG: DUF2207 domain-containing protein [Actinobacteria bacterium]|nr:DUF2207 domain-containing protein [Actinomycetota bacterium]